MALAKRLGEERWQAKRSTVLERSKYMFDNPDLISDIKFAFPNKTTIAAHKYVLSVSSPVFFAMFYGVLAERGDIIKITDCDPDAFSHFLRFLYCDEANFQEPVHAIKVWYLADKYDIPSLAIECAAFLDGNMDPLSPTLSVFHVISYARQFRDEKLEQSCWEVIDYNAETIVDDGAFLDLEHEFVLLFLERSSLHIEEIKLFNAVDRWATKRCKEENMTVDGPNKRSVLGNDLLQRIRFPLMRPKQFSNEVLPKIILTEDEVIDVFSCFYSHYEVARCAFSVVPRVNSALVHSFRMSNDPLLLTNWHNVNESVMLTFEVNEPIHLCGLEFLFNPTATDGCVSLLLWRQGVKIKQLTAKSRPDSWNTDSFYGENKVFFNRPFSVDARTCYTIELLGASSRSPTYYVTNKSSGFTTLQEEEDLYIIEGVTLRFCEGLFVNDIPRNRPYLGHIEKLLFQ